MSNYIDAVLVKHPSCDKLFLFQAPAFSYLNEGNNVICETKVSPEAEGEVVAIRTVEKNSAELQFIAKCSGATLPLNKIKAIVRVSELKYEDEESTESGTE